MKTQMSLQDKAEVALKEAVKEVVARHKKTGRPLAVWENGKVMRISPDKVFRQGRCFSGKGRAGDRKERL